jgi:hypothetical protein
MLKPVLLGAALSLAVSAHAQTTPPETATPSTTAPSDNRAAILDDAPTTPRAGETDVGATGAPDYRPAGVGEAARPAKTYPRCSRTRTDSCTQSPGRRRQR